MELPVCLLVCFVFLHKAPCFTVDNMAWLVFLLVVLMILCGLQSIPDKGRIRTIPTKPSIDMIIDGLTKYAA